MVEVLAPAGDEASLMAALAAGADAVYLGLDGGLNARARATNVSAERLPALVDLAHLAGARLFLTMNVLVFEDELGFVERAVRAAAEAGVDALIVQDPAVALIARAVAPTLALHASTQMTVSSPEGAAFAASLGATRIVVPRELSVDEIRAFAARSPVPLEVFVHGALCMSWSGQCLTSEAWGGRSANRGQCAQSCRLPYTLVVDGVLRPAADAPYLLSPLDLAGIDAVGALVHAGVVSLKIEGRLKGPAYVATAVASYRRAVQAAPAPSPTRHADLTAMATTYSRGFSTGFLLGTDHTALVPARFPKHRGVLLGRVAAIDGARVEIADVGEVHGLARPPAVVAGMGIGFDTGHPEQDEPGGRVFAVDGRWIELGEVVTGVRVGDRVWITSDPRLGRLPPFDPWTAGRLPVDVTVGGALGEPLWATFAIGEVAVTGHTEVALTPSRGGALPLDKLTAFGGTPLHLATLRSELPAEVHVPVSALKGLRRTLVGALVPAYLASRRHRVRPDPFVPAPAPAPRPAPDVPRLVPLCRTAEQLEVVIARGLPEVELDFMDRVGLGRAVARARQAGLRVVVATTRVHKPLEEAYDEALFRLAPDAVLVRHWGVVPALAGRTGPRPEVLGDFSLNVTNAVTANHLLDHGYDGITAAHDLDERQLFAMLAHVPAERVTVVVHHHIPTFHTEHCVYAAHLSADGRDYRTCGRPCEAHRVALRDRDGRDHPVVVDVGCRNTVFDARAQCAPAVALRAIAAGVRRLRVEFVWEDAATTGTVLDAWGALLAGALGPAGLLARVAAHEQFGVTGGTLRTLSG